MFARTSDPATSHEAISIAGAAALREAVLKELRAMSPQGATSEELADKIGVGRDSVSPRMKGLRDCELVKAAGKRAGRSGKKQTVWAAIAVAA